MFDDPPLRTAPYLQDVTVDGATIAMITAAPVAAQVVVTNAAGARVAELRDEACRRHVLRVEGLQPGQEYGYEVRLADGRVESGRLRTPPSGDSAPVRFAFVGDSGGQPWWVWLQRTPILHLPAAWQWLPTRSEVTRIGAAMAADGPDFALHLGDIVYPEGLHAHYSSGYFRPFAELGRNTPVYALLGNHDFLDVAGLQALQNFPGSRGALTGDGRCFTFAWGAVRVIVLDLNTRLESGHPCERYLLEQLALCPEPWVVVASHFPMLSASRQKDRPDLCLSLAPVLEEWGVTLYLSGHDHCYQRFGPSPVAPVPLIVSGGGGKSLYDISRDPRIAGRAERLASAYHWCQAEVAGASMEVHARGLDGEVLDTFRIALPEGESLERIRKRNPARAARIEALGR
ncbi:MAG: metallophosphoesterase [Planctomycetes bacterium]|nr:metallophosphoesterase [Planctomycetota bacterium]